MSIQSSYCYLTDFTNIYFCQTSYVKVSAVSCRLLSWCKMPGFILIFGARVSSSEHSMLSAWLTPLCQFSMSVCVEWVKVYRDNFIERWAVVCVCVFEREREREVVLLWGNQAFFPFLRARLFEWISSFTKESSDEHLTPYSKGAPLQSTQWVTNTHMYIHTR